MTDTDHAALAIAAMATTIFAARIIFQLSAGGRWTDFRDETMRQSVADARMIIDLVHDTRPPTGGEGRT